MEAEVRQGHPVDDWEEGPVSCIPTSAPPQEIQEQEKRHAGEPTLCTSFQVD